MPIRPTQKSRRDPSWWRNAVPPLRRRCQTTTKATVDNCSSPIFDCAPLETHPSNASTRLSAARFAMESSNDKWARSWRCMELANSEPHLPNSRRPRRPTAARKRRWICKSWWAGAPCATWAQRREAEERIPADQPDSQIYAARQSDCLGIVAREAV